MKKIIHNIVFLSLILLLSEFKFLVRKAPAFRVLIFSKTEGYRHKESIEEGKKAFFKLATDHDFIIDTSETSEDFNEKNLHRYRAIVFLDISGSVFNSEQRVSLQRYVQAGGGILSIHASADAERDWPWFGNMLGGYFDSHPPIQKGRYVTTDKNHPASSFMPDTLSRTVEFYNFQQVSPNIKILVSLDEKTYTGGNMGASHPAVWYQEFDGGRSFYTSWGHTRESWRENLFLQQVWNGLYWVSGENYPKPLDYSKSIPEENRFTQNILTSKIDEPIQMAIAKNGNVFIAQRRGNILMYDAATKITKSIGTIPVLSAYEDGLLGIAVDPNFQLNKFLYVFYAELAAKDAFCNYHISRFMINSKGLIDFESEKVLIKIPHQNADGIHTGGGMMFDPRGNGNLFVTVGDNSSPRATLYAPLDERPGRELYDAQRSASNTNDLRGKILRIHPEANGTYTIPEGNLFPKGMDKTRPEIYSMGHRQPWRLSMDTKTGWLYEGEVGPDASFDSSGRGPMAYDEFNQIRKPGNFGWPYFGGNNRPYYEYDFATGKSGEAFNQAKPVNNSRLNTGLTELPPAQGSMICYSNTAPKEFPIMGGGARSAMGGPLFRISDYKNSKKSFPAYYDGKWFITEWLRDWIIVVSMDSSGNYKSMEKFVPSIPVAGAIDMQFGPDGCLYVLEYGKGWFRQNNDSKLIRIDYNGGNRSPVAVINADRVNGSVPFKMKLSAAGSRDYDNDSIKYEWRVTSKAGDNRKFILSNPVVSFNKTGVYNVTLIVTDSKGAKGEQSIQVYAGNEAPVVDIRLSKGNRSFYFPSEEIAYEVVVTDKEDGRLSNGKIDPSKVFVNMNYLPDGFNPAVTKEQLAERRGTGIKGGIILNTSDCYSCHAINTKSVGPTFKDVAVKYKGDLAAEERLAKKVISGGSGVWGHAMMSAHPDLSMDDAKKMVNFILNLTQAPPKSLPVIGTHVVTLPARLTPKGVYLLQATYTDKGANGLPVANGEATIVLKAPSILPSQANKRKGGMNVKSPNPKGEVEILQGSGSFIAYNSIDLTEIKRIEMTGVGSAILEIRIDSATGKMIGSTADAQSENNSEERKINIEATTGIHDIYFVINGRSYSIKNYIRFAR